MSVSRDLMAKSSTKLSVGESKTQERTIERHMLPQGAKGYGQQWGGSGWQAQRDRGYLGENLMSLKMLSQAGNSAVHPFACPECHGWP